MQHLLSRLAKLGVVHAIVVDAETSGRGLPDNDPAFGPHWALHSAINKVAAKTAG